MRNNDNSNIKLSRKDFAVSDDSAWIYGLIYKIRDALVKVRGNELKLHGVSSTESLVLFVLYNIGHMATPTEISRHMLREPNTVIALLNRMEKKELIKKSRDLNRKNIWRVALTEKGKNLHRQCIKMEAINNILSNFSKEEKMILISTLEKLQDESFKQLARDSSRSYLELARMARIFR